MYLNSYFSVINIRLLSTPSNMFCLISRFSNRSMFNRIVQKCEGDKYVKYFISLVSNKNGRI